jgi:hypothetical protein
MPLVEHDNMAKTFLPDLAHVIVLTVPVQIVGTIGP